MLANPNTLTNKITYLLVLTTLVAMFYSQRSRKVILEASKLWDKHSPLFKSLKRILKDKYLKEGKGESKEYRDFADKTFLDLLILLFKKDQGL